MKLLRTFTIDLSGTTCEIDAMIGYASYIIMDVRPSDGFPFEFTADDMETFEQHVDSQIQTTEIEAYSFTSGRMERFQIVSHQGAVLAVIDAGGYTLPRHDPQFTEAAEAFALDAQYAEAVESDQPHLAAMAGYPARPIPSQQGIGYRRAA